jgi:hypothetical protein
MLVRFSKLLFIIFYCFAWTFATAVGQVHTPAKGSGERQAILDALRNDYIQPHKGKLTFKVKYLRVHDGWAWLYAEPISTDPRDSFGETYGFLLHKVKGMWRVMDLPEMVEDPSDPEKLNYPNLADIRKIKKKYPAMPTDIFRKYGRQSASIRS